MAAWYILSALGFYPLCPGKPEYTLGAPLFPHSAVHLSSGKSLVIEAPGNGPKTPYATRIMVDEAEHRSTAIEHGTLVRGSRLRFQMSETASRG